MKKIALILCAVLLLGILAGCGSKELDAPWEFDLESHWQVDENGEIYECKIKPFRDSDKALLNMLLR